MLILAVFHLLFSSYTVLISAWFSLARSRHNHTSKFHFGTRMEILHHLDDSSILNGTTIHYFCILSSSFLRVVVVHR